MNLFINAVSVNWFMALFNEKRKIIFYKDIKVLWNESELLINIIDSFLKENNFSYNTLQNIVTVSWPGSFTWIRTISLLVNTIAFVNKNIFLTDISFFDLYDKYPICKSSSKRDSFILFEKWKSVEIYQNTDLINIFSEKNIEIVYGELNIDTLNNISIIDKIDYEYIIKQVQFKNKRQIDALYIKKPNIS